MPVHVEEFESEIAFSDEDAPLSPRQMEAIVARVKAELRRDRHDQAANERATALRAEATPASAIGD